MKFLGEELKPGNKSLILILLILGIVWRIIMGKRLENLADPYFIPIIGFFMISVICGELTRRIIKLFREEKTQADQEIKEDINDIQVLYYAISWSLLWILLAILF